MRWPKISWKKTPEARPEKIAGPTNGSAVWARGERFDVFADLLDRGRDHVVRGKILRIGGFE